MKNIEYVKDQLAVRFKQYFTPSQMQYFRSILQLAFTNQFFLLQLQKALKQTCVLADLSKTLCSEYVPLSVADKITKTAICPKKCSYHTS